MKCPKCNGILVISDKKEHANGYSEYEWCIACGTTWTNWQQARIEGLEERLADAEGIIEAVIDDVGHVCKAKDYFKRHGR